MRVSIKKQLAKWFVPVLIGLWVGSALLSYCLIAGVSREYFDKELLNSADSVVGRLRVKSGKVVVDLPPAAQAILKQDDSDEFYYCVLNNDGQRIFGDPKFRKPAQDLQIDTPRLETIMIGNKEARLVEMRVTVEDAQGESVIVQVAQTTRSRAIFQQKMLLSIAMPQLIVVVIGLLALWYVLTKVLAPLKHLQSHLSSRSQFDLSHVPDQDTPEEVYPLVRAINQLLSRLSEELKAHHRFIANAAHQLRTPLAGLKTYSSIGTEMSEVSDLKHIVKELDQGIDRSSRMVNQLLALARADGPDQSDATVKKNIDLNFIVSDVATALIQEAVRKDLELAYEPSFEPAFVCGDQTSLRHLASNLLENAILYTPQGGTIKVRVLKNKKGIILTVEDTGPGIPLDEREKVFERFYRVVGTPGDGSGLGLAIVKEVASTHDGVISIDDPHGTSGTVISVKFPGIS